MDQGNFRGNREITMRSPGKWKVLFWDLDGTITDPRRGIIDSYIAYLREAEVPVPAEKDLFWVIGPPLRECLAKLLNTTDSARIEDAVTRYRHWYVNEGLMYRDTPYPGIESLLSELKNSGYRMFIATAKAHSYARMILRHWNLERYFEAVHGSELDGTRSNKADLLRWMTTELDLGEPGEIVMIGDRSHDIIAAKKNGIASIGIGYGYGSQDELTSAGATYYAPDIASLRATLVSAPR
jgi:phosphoglycolate phosphatase